VRGTVHHVRILLLGEECALRVAVGAKGILTPPCIIP
jgi:hypothetical protein